MFRLLSLDKALDESEHLIKLEEKRRITNEIADHHGFAVTVPGDIPGQRRDIGIYRGEIDGGHVYSVSQVTSQVVIDDVGSAVHIEHLSYYLWSNDSEKHRSLDFNKSLYVARLNPKGGVLESEFETGSPEQITLGETEKDLATITNSRLKDMQGVVDDAMDFLRSR